MTPAINFLRQQGISHEIHPFEQADEDVGYALGAAQALGVEPGCVFKTLMVAGSDEFACAMVPANAQLNLKRLAKCLGWKKITMAQAKDAERVTGYKVGGISPLGQRRRHPTVIDESALQHSQIYCSAGQRGLDLAISPPSLIELGITPASIADFVS